MERGGIEGRRNWGCRWFCPWLPCRRRCSVCAALGSGKHSEKQDSLCASYGVKRRNGSLKPLQRLRAWFDIQFDFLKQADFRNGCLIGNFSAEVGAHSDTIHEKLNDICAEIHESVVYCLKAAVKACELPATADCKELAYFLYSSLQPGRNVDQQVID